MNEELKKAIQEMKDSSIDRHHNSSTLEDEVYPPITSPKEEDKCLRCGLPLGDFSKHHDCSRTKSKSSPKVSEWETEFDEKFTHMGKNQADQLDIVWNGMVTIPSMKQFISSRQISLIKMIVDMVESEKKDGSDETRNRIEKDGYGYLYERLIGHNIALDTISSKLKELVKE